MTNFLTEPLVFWRMMDLNFAFLMDPSEVREDDEDFDKRNFLELDLIKKS